MHDDIFSGPLMVRGRGVGFFRLPQATENDEDIVLKTEDLGLALDGDIVEISLLPPIPGERQGGKVVRVIERAREEFIGVVQKSDKNHSTPFLLPDNTRIHVHIALPKATESDFGMKVVASIDTWNDASKPPIGSIVEVLGRAGQHETEMQAIIRGGGFSENFPTLVSDAARELYEKREKIFERAVEDTKGPHPLRKDLRERLTFTIDPADAKDFDDALSVHELENGNYEIGIHIADVSHYVTEGDDVDIEAKERGTSIYLVDRVIPMLPEVLSNDLCSLRPKEDRLAFSALFELDEKAGVVNEWYGQTVIHSDRRFTYEEAQQVLDEGTGDHYGALTTLMLLGRILRERRYKDGAIAFEQPEVRFELDENGKPIRAYTKVRTETMLMIEDFMLLANQRVSEYIYKLTKSANKDAAFIYRIHDAPDPDKIEELSTFIHALGYEFETNKGVVTAKNINKLLKEVEGTPEENLIKTATIRSMAKAVYSTKNIGHFGLAFKYYTHFTSPIRRYPDLLAHRLLRKHLDGSTISTKEMARYERIAIQCSEREMYAVRAERDSIKFKQVEFMQNKEGQVFEGVVTGVTDWGIYVQEKESQAEGMVRLGTLRGDYFIHEANRYRVKGEKTGTAYALGDAVRIKLTKVNLEERQIDFELVIQ